MNILITGITGFIGRHVANQLIKTGNNIIAPVRLKNSGSFLVREFVNRDVKIIYGDFYDTNLINEISQSKIDLIIHLASIRGEGFGSREEYQKVNVQGTEILLEFAQTNKIKRFLYCSTVGVLGTIPGTQLAKSTDDSNPDNLYHKSKWQSEQLVKKYHSSRLQTIILRPTITYGPGDNGFLSKLVNMVNKKKIILPKKDVYIHLLWVDSFAKLISDLVNSSDFNGKTYNIADKNPMVLSELVNMISTSFNNSAYPSYYYFPNIFFKAIEFISKMIKQDRLLTSIKLINNNWTYDISDLCKDFHYKPADTDSEIKNIIMEYINAG